MDSYKIDDYQVDDDGLLQLGKFDEWQLGINYWPVPNVVIKADYRERNYDKSLAADNLDFTGIDFGLGYSF